MIARTLRARVALWTVAVVSGTLILFGGGAAWNLRRELVKNLDAELAADGRDLLSEIEERPGDWSRRKSGAAFLKEESNPFDDVEVQDDLARYNTKCWTSREWLLKSTIRRWPRTQPAQPREP